jgi:starch-binding outer membrane protein, SusD/RagB family
MNTLRMPTVGRALRGAALVGLLATAACDDFIAPPEGDPNAVPAATIDQLFTAIQVNSFFFNESQMARIAAMWTQQMAGTDRQFTILDQYTMQEEESNVMWLRVYTGGGLVDIRRGIEMAEASGRPAYAGILKIHEAYLVGMAASIWGNIPYSQAVNPEFTHPELDSQAEVYAAVQTLLDRAIADLAGGGAPPSSVDMNFAANTQRWIAVANSLKARFYMHVATRNPAGATAEYTAARTAALSGIREPQGNWRSIHGSPQMEQNMWHQFLRERSGYIHAGRFAVEALRARNDPRLTIYYSANDAGMISGSPPGTSGSGWSVLNLPGTATYVQPIVTCAETEFIIAEAEYRLGNIPQARQALQRGVACQEAWWALRGAPITIPLAVDPNTATGTALLEEIMMQKYFANFLNIEAWNDYKRTCIPRINTYDGKVVPRRMFYPANERQNNPNIPEPGADPGVNPLDWATAGTGC